MCAGHGQVANAATSAVQPTRLGLQSLSFFLAPTPQLLQTKPPGLGLAPFFFEHDTDTSSRGDQGIVTLTGHDNAEGLGLGGP